MNNAAQLLIDRPDHHDEPMTTSLAIAEGTESTHAAIIKMVRNRVGEFIGHWLDGRLPLPVVVCRSSDLYAAYLHWATVEGIGQQAPQTLFGGEAARSAQDLVFRVVHVAERPGERRSARAVIPPGSLGVPMATSGMSNAQTIPAFAQAVKDWR